MGVDESSRLLRIPTESGGHLLGAAGTEQRSGAALPVDQGILETAAEEIPLLYHNQPRRRLDGWLTLAGLALIAAFLAFLVTWRFETEPQPGAREQIAPQGAAAPGTELATAEIPQSSSTTVPETQSAETAGTQNDETQLGSLAVASSQADPFRSSAVRAASVGQPEAQPASLPEAISREPEPGTSVTEPVTLSEPRPPATRGGNSRRAERNGA